MPGLNDDSVERQELHCHACDRYVQFDIDLAINGNHVLNCPNCGHEHCRVVWHGKITGERWDTRNGDTYMANIVCHTVVSTANSVSNFIYIYATNTTTAY